jgi:hypothetical protein
MADVKARVLAGADGQVVLILFSDEKTAGGASLRYASLSVEDGGMLLRIDTHDHPSESELHDVSTVTLGVALLRAFAHVQPRRTEALEVEIAYFNRNRERLVKDYAGQFLLIKGEDLIGSFTTEAQAYEVGVERLGNSPFLIKRAADREIG